MSTERTPLLAPSTMQNSNSYTIEAGEVQHRKPCKLQRWREDIGEWIEGRKVHTGVLILVLVDLTVVLAEIITTFLEQKNCESPVDSHPLWLSVLGHISTAILAIFVLETLVRLFAFGFRYFTHNPLHLFDATVVIASFVLDVTLKGRAEEVAGLLIVLRCWRLVRIVDGVAMAVENRVEEQVKALKEENQKLKEELESLRRNPVVHENSL